MPRLAWCLLATLTGAAASYPEFTREGDVHRHTEDKPRYDAHSCFPKAGVDSLMTPNRDYWVKPKRNPTTKYAWTPRPRYATESCLKRNGTEDTRIVVPTAAEARRALANHTIVVIGDSLGTQLYVSLAALLVCAHDGEGDAKVQKNGKLSGKAETITLPEHNIVLRHADSKFGIDPKVHLDRSGGAWFIDEHGKKQSMRSSGKRNQLWPWGTSKEPPSAHTHVQNALKDFKDRKDVTYVVMYGHWLTTKRSDVSIFSKTGKSVSAGAKTYTQTYKVLAKALADGMAPTHRAVFLGYSPIIHATSSEVCSHDSQMSRAAQAGLKDFTAERDGIFFLDMECPFVKLGHTAFAYHSPGHRHLPGGPDMANAIVMRLIECESSPVPAYRRARSHRSDS